jgi:ABC-type multidrug transport system fused ATPase/permease subunit
MLKSLRLTLSFMTKRERATYVILVAVRALAGLLDVFGVVLIGVLAAVAGTSIGDPSAAPVTILGFALPKLDEQALLLLVVFVLVIFALKALIAITLSRVLTSFVARVEAASATKIANYILRSSLGDVQKYSKADVQWAVTGSTSAAFTGLLNDLAILLAEGLLLILIGATFIAVSPLSALVITAYFAGVIILIQFVIGKSIKKAGVDATEGTVDTTGAVNDTLDTFREISVLSKQDLFIDRFSLSRLRLARSSGTMTFLGGMPRYVVETSLMLGVVLFVGWLFLTGQLASGLVIIGIFLTGGVRIMASLLPLQNAVTQAALHVTQGRQSLELLGLARAQQAERAGQREQPDATIQYAKNGGLEVVVDTVDFTHPGNDETTLNDISLSIKGGSHVAFIGPSGAGKTTLVDLLLGLIVPDSGTVTIGGVEPALLRREAPGLVSYVPQNPGLVSGTIAENIALGVAPADIDYARVDTVVESAYLTDFIAGLPDGLATSVGKQADALSGGQIQRLGLARALYSQPKLIILDEATSALDASSEAFISSSLTKLGPGVTVVVIAHRLSTVQHSDEVFVVENGAITASGKFSALRKTVPMVAEYVKLMSFDDN